MTSSTNAYNSSTKSAYAGPSKPSSALRRGKFDVSGKAHQPRQILDISIIFDAFGEHVSLYDVLHVKCNAKATDIQRAYLGQGRAVLINDGFVYNAAEDAPLAFDDVAEQARKTFQAISIAYEILSTPTYRSDYDRYGVVYAQPPTPLSNVSERRPLKRTVSWRPYVEERFIEAFNTDEHSHRAEIKEAAEETYNSWIESNLRSLDEETEKFLRDDLLDSFDESLMSLQDSVESFIESIGSKDYTNGTDDSDVVEQNNHVAVTLESKTHSKNYVTDLQAKSLMTLQNSFDSLLEKMRNRISTCVTNDATDGELNEGDPKANEMVPQKKNFSENLHAVRTFFWREPQIGAEHRQTHQIDTLEIASPALHSPCSVTCMDDVTDGAMLCGLSDSLYDLLGKNDTMAAYSMGKSDLVM